MSRVCRICLGTVNDESDYHERCLRALFRTGKLPTLDIEVSKLHTAALAMVGHTSLSGIQKKISVNLSADRATLQVAAEGGRYILKPQTDTYPNLPENEHLTTRLAQLVEIDVAPFGLVSLKDSSLAYIVRRFDRRDDGTESLSESRPRRRRQSPFAPRTTQKGTVPGGSRIGFKVRQEDFCQLAEQSPKEKYDGSAELCVRLLRKYASEPLIEILKLYRLLVFAWWSGNGDLHLKNLSVLTDEQGVTQLTPAYDLLCTRLVIRDDPLALPVSGKKENLRRGDWLQFARYCRLPESAANRVLAAQATALEPAQDLIGRGFLPAEAKAEYQQLIAERSARLE